MWEYTTFISSLLNPNDKLNEYGRRGWEAYAIIQYVDDLYKFFLKKKIC